MNTEIDTLNSADDLKTTHPLVDISQLVAAVYEAAPEEQKDQIVAQLVGKIYQEAPLAQRSQILEHLIRPLSILSLVTVANGVFAKIGFHSGWTSVQTRMEDVKSVEASDVTTLTDYVQQVSVQAVNNLAHLIASQPMLTGSAAAAMLITVLMKRGKFRRADDFSRTIAP